jgi:heme exporter protein D
MIWSSFSEFITMNGYGTYVWGSFGVTFLLFFFEQVSLKRMRQKIYANHL